MKIIEVNNLKKSFGNLNVLKGVSFNVNKGDIIAAIGPSGSGKSTLLRSLINLEKADSGDIIIEGKHLCKNGIYPNKKEIKTICQKMGMVFQHFNLFPHMTIKNNLLCAPLSLKLASKNELNDLCAQTLNKVGLYDKINEMPSKLSGGQKQRVAIARALMLNPDIMLFDEPTSALDPELTKEVLNVIKNLSKDNMTMIIVTHEIGFAKEASNKVIFMDNGTILAEGNSENIIDNSNNERIRSFIEKVM